MNVNVAPIVENINYADALGPRQQPAPNFTPPSFQVRAYPGIAFQAPLNPLAGPIQGQQPPDSALVVPVFFESAGTRFWLVWEDDIVNAFVLNDQDGLTLLWIRSDAIVRSVEILTPGERERQYVNGRIAALADLDEGDVHGDGLDGRPRTFGPDCPSSLRRTFCC